MKSRIFKIIPIIFILLAILSVNVYAVTYSSTDRTVDSEGDISITVKASENVQNYDISLTSYTGLTYVSCSANENAAVNSSTGAVSYATLGSGTSTLATYKFKAPKVTKDTTYNVVFDINGTANTAKVTVKAKEEKPTTPTQPETPSTPQTPTTPQQPEKPVTPTVIEPNFTSADKIMYATGDINLRASWSTSSAATQIEKGTELKVIATSTNKVNDYVWYKVNYNGATKYVASSLLTSTKLEEKSSNAYLKSLTIEGEELLPTFNKETTSYTMQVESDVTELNIKAEAEHEKATVEIQGNKDLKDGENTVTISVNAEDNTIKIYEITVTKSEKIALGLKSLDIKDKDIKNEFKTDVYSYEIDVEDVTKLDIEAIANDEKATVEILGNEDLQDGENTITIIVSSEDGKEKVTYQIKVNKGIVGNDITTDKEPPKQQIDTKIYLYIGLGAVLLIALIIVIVYVIEHRNQEEDEFEYSDNIEDFPGELPNVEEKGMFNKDLNIEQTQPIDTINNDYQEKYEKENSNEEIIEDEIMNEEERKAKIDYFLGDTEDDENPRRRRGKHF